MTNTAPHPTVDVERLRRIVEISETEHAALLRADQKLKDLRDKLADAERRQRYVAEWGGRSVSGDSREDLERASAAADAAETAQRQRLEAEVGALRAAYARGRAARDAAGERHREAARLAGACREHARRVGALPPDLRDDFGRAAVEG